MKKHMNYISFIFSFLLVLFLAACEGGNTDSSYYENERTSEETLSEESNNENDYLIESQENQHIVSEAYAAFEAHDFNQSKLEVLNLIENYQGTIQRQSQSTDQSSLGNTGSRLEIEVHINAEEFNQFSQDLEGIESLFLQSQILDSRDESKNYLSRETRIETLHSEEELIRNQLEEYEVVDDSYRNLQRQLLDVLTEIESLEREREESNGRVEYVPVQILIQEASRVNKRNVEGFWQRIWNETVDAFYRFLMLLSDLITLIIRLIPILLILGIVYAMAWGIWQLVRKLLAQFRKNPAEKDEKNTRSSEVSLEEDSQMKLLPRDLSHTKESQAKKDSKKASSSDNQLKEFKRGQAKEKEDKSK